MSRHWVVLVLSAMVGGCAPVNLSPVQRIETLYRGGSARSWDKGRDEKRLQREFVAYQIGTLRDPSGVRALRWRFEPRSVTYSDVFVRKPIDAGFRGIRVRVNNTGPPVKLAVKIADANGAEWSVEPVDVGGPGWRDVEWPREAFRVAGWSQDPDGRLDLPAQYLAVIAFGVAPGQRYELWIEHVLAIREVVVVPGVRIAVPDKIRAGEVLPITMHYLGPPRAAPWWIEMTQDGQQVLLRRLGKLQTGLPVGMPLPRYMAGGRYEVRPRLGDMPVLDKLAGAPIMTPITIEPHQSNADDTVAVVRQSDGVPTLFINEQPDSCMVYMTYRPNAKYFGQFGRAGVRLYSFSSTPSASEYGLSPPTWVSPDEFDYGNLDDRARMVLDATPEAYFFPRIYLFSPAWWDEQHPDDLVTYDPGDGRPKPFARDGRKRAPSWASPAWREFTADAIRRYIKYVEQSPYADRVIGYHLASGTTEEWMMWGANENQWVDYSPVNVAAFRAWLTERYGTDEALKSAWRDEGVTLQTATIPTKVVRARTAFGILRDPARERNVIDFMQYNSDLVAETIAYFARVVKDATRRKKLVGVFYGYVLQLMGQRQQNAGHLALDKVLSNADVDFITSPTSYAFRTPGTGYSHFMSLTDSVKLHGKLWINENDIRTWLTSVKTGQWGKTDTYDETLRQQRRELASTLGQGCGQWWFDMGGGWYDDSRMMGQIARMKRIADKTVGRPRAPISEIAVVVDDKSLSYLQPGNRLSAPLLLHVLPHLARVGAPLSYYALSDLSEAPKHKMYVFLNAFAPDHDDRQAIEALKSEGRVLMFFWAAGLYRDERIDPKGVTDLVGMQVSLAADRGTMSGRYVEGAEWIRDMAGESVGVELSVAPSFAVDDPDATVLARGSRGARGRSVLALREHDDWTSVYAAIPVHSRELYRSLAERAGVHCYVSTPDVVYGTQSLLGIACNRAGKRTVRLRAPARVWDAFSDRLVANGVSEFPIDVPEHGTALLVIEPSER